jgi:DNA-binding SARP family transcriptional activator
LPDDQYEPWVERRADALRLRYLQLLHLARRWNDIVELDPADERAHLALTQHHIQQGNRQAALRQLERLESALSDLGLALSADAAQARLQLITDGTAQLSGSHRLSRTRGTKHRFEHRRVVASACTYGFRRCRSVS